MPLSPIQIGNISIENPVFLAPMAGVTDRSFRLICKKQGCGMVYSEMVSAKSILYDNAHTKQLLDSVASERPWAVQLFGSEPEVLAEAAKRIEALPFDILDINMGCPMPKIVNNGEGCALMNDPIRAGRIVEAVSRAIAKPVTVKIRKGFSQKNANAAALAYIAQESGAAAVAVHGRTRDQLYAGTADWEIIAAVKQAVRIPVVGNGDVVSPESAFRLFKETGCDAIMAGRGALGNPWLFRQITDFLKDETLTPLPSWMERRETALGHMRMVIEHKGERTGLLEMRKHFSWYIKGMPNAARMRLKINKAETVSEMEAALYEMDE